MIIVALLLHVLYALSLSLFANNKRVRLDRFSTCAVILYHSIWASWVIEGFWRIQPVFWLQVVAGCLFFVFGIACATWAIRSNPLFTPNLEVPDRIIATGAYAYMRHPAYLGFLLMSGGTFLTLNHKSGIFPLVAYWAMLSWRIKQENKILNSCGVI